MRIHLCQIWYNPAYFDAEYDLLEEPAPSMETSRTIGQLRRIEPIQDLLIEYRASYVKHITDKLCAIASWSKSRGAGIIVFPEYSVPAEALPAIRDIAKEAGVLIVAGTHKVRITESSKKTYESIGLDISNIQNGCAISPIIHPTGTVGISVKRYRSKWEPSLDVTLQTSDIHEVNLYDRVVRVAVVPCIDALQLDTFAALWADEDGKPDIVICPSLSPTTDLFENIGNLLAAHETVFAFANSAMFGGTAFNVPDAWKQHLPGGQWTYGCSIAHYEAVVELDVDANAFFMKKGSLEAEPPCSNVKHFPIVYASTSSWVDEYIQLEKDILELLDDGDSNTAIDWIDGSLIEQNVPLPDEIVSRLQRLRHGQLMLFSGDMEAVKEGLMLVLLAQEVEDSRLVFANRTKELISLVTTTLQSSTGEATELLINYLVVLKNNQSDFSLSQYDQTYINQRKLASLEEILEESVYRPPESTIAAFQNRGSRLDQLRDIIIEGNDKVIAITGLLGIGKTELVRSLFLKVLTDWKTIWVNVARDSSVARVAALIGKALGVTMDIDALGDATTNVFRGKMIKLFDTFFSTERYALIIDDLKDLRGNTRDYHQLQTLIEVASEPKRFKGSRLFLISSVPTTPIWVKRAGVARVHLRGLDEIYTKRILEYQFRSSGLVSGETMPDIPQRLLDTISGHPLAARIAAEASRQTGLEEMATDEQLDSLTANVIDVLLPRIELSSEEATIIQSFSVFRLPVNAADIATLIDEKILGGLAARGMMDFDGYSYEMHEVFRRHFLGNVSHEKQPSLHETAANYYRRLDEKNLAMGKRDMNVVAELAHHLSFKSGAANELYVLRVLVFDELFPAARTLYGLWQYDKALEVFRLLTECRPNDPNIWAYVGRCYGRRGQWQDSDEAFEKAIQVASATRQPTWWIHRDWGHIRARFGFHSDAQQHLNDAKEQGGQDDPSLMSADAYVKWRTDDVDTAIREFEYILNHYEDHGYTLKTYSMLLDEIGEKEHAKELRERLRVIESEMTTPRPYDIEVEGEAED